MNKIYKIVWNAARNCYVVASEFASGKDATGIFRSTFVNQVARRVMMTAVVTMACLLTFGCVPGLGEAAEPTVSTTANHQYVAIDAGGNLNSTYNWNYVFMTDDNSIVYSSTGGTYGDGTTGGKLNSDGSITGGNTVTVGGKQYTFTNYNQGVYTLTATDGSGTLNAYRYGKYTLRKPDGTVDKAYRIRADEQGSNQPSYSVTEQSQGGYYTSDDLTADREAAPTSQNVFVVSYQGEGDQPKDILNKVDHVTSATGVSTNLNEQLQTTSASTYTSAATGGSLVGGTWDYYIYDDATNSYKNVRSTSGGSQADGVTVPNRFVKASDSRLQWSDSYNAYVYTPTGGTATVVPTDNMYVINGNLGIFTNSDGTLYTGTVYGGGNEILLTTSQNGTIYSFWGAQSVDTAQTMQNYPVSKYNGDIATLTNNDKVLAHNDINHVKVEATTSESNSSVGTATISMYRNGTNMKGDETAANLVDNQIIITPGGGSGGIGTTHDRTLTIADSESQGNNNRSRTFRVGSTVGATHDIVGTGTGHELQNTTQNLQTLTINGTTYGLKTMYAGDDNSTVTRSLGQTLSITGGASTDSLTIGNIGVVANGTNGLLVKLAENVNLTADGSLTVGNTKIESNGLTVTPTTGSAISVTTSGISAGEKKISNVASGTTGNVWSTTNLPVSGSTTDSANWNNAANIGDIYDLMDSQVEVTGTTPNIIVSKNTGKTSSYNVALSDDITLGGSTSAPIHINGSGTNASISLGNTSGNTYVSFNGTTGSGNVGKVNIGETSADTSTYTNSTYSAGTEGTIDGKTVTLKSVTTTTPNSTGSSLPTTGTESGTYVTGLTNKTWDWRNLTVSSGRAATEDQLLLAGQHFFSINPQNDSVTESSIPNYYNEGASGAASMAIGHGVTTAASATQSIAIGAHGTSTGTVDASGNASGGEGSLAVGYHATAQGNQTIAIGNTSDAAGDRSISIGNYNFANGVRSISLGVNVQSGYTSANADVNENSYASGKMEGGADIALGNLTRVYGTGSTALGFGAIVGQTKDDGTLKADSTADGVDLAVAIGGRSVASVDGGVALGNISVADRAAGSSGAYMSDHAVDANGNDISAEATAAKEIGRLKATYTTNADGTTTITENELKDGDAWHSNMGAVSIGSETARTAQGSDQVPVITRQLTGLAAGTKDTDAVNVAQLRAAANAGLKFQGQNTDDSGNLVTIKRALGDTLQVQGTSNSTVDNTSGNSNIYVTADTTNNRLSVALNDDVKLHTITAGTIGSNSTSTARAGTVTIVGLNGNEYTAYNITSGRNNNAADLENSTDRLSYTVGNNTTTHTLATLDDGLKFAGDDKETNGHVVRKLMDQTMSITGGADTSNLTDDKNIGVVADDTDGDGKNDGLKLKLAKDITGLNTVQAGASTTDTDNNGTSFTSSYATIGNQTVNVSDSDTSDTNPGTETGNYVTGLTNRKWTVGQTKYVSGRAATEDQLKTVSDQVSTNTTNISGNTATINAGWNAAVVTKATNTETTTNTTTINITPKDSKNTLTINEGDNIVLTPSKDSQSIGVATTPIVGFTTVHVGGTGTGNSATGGITLGSQTNTYQHWVTTTDTSGNTTTTLEKTTDSKGNTSTSTGLYITGLQNTTWDGTNFVSGRAATEDQLRAAIQTSVSAASDTDHYITNGTVNWTTNTEGNQTGTGNLVLTRRDSQNDDGTVNASTVTIDGLHDYYVTNATTSTNGNVTTVTLTRNDGQQAATFNLDFPTTDYRVTSGSYSDGTLSLTVQDGTDTSNQSTVKITGLNTLYGADNSSADDNSSKVVTRNFGERLNIIGNTTEKAKTSQTYSNGNINTAVDDNNNIVISLNDNPTLASLILQGTTTGDTTPTITLDMGTDGRLSVANGSTTNSVAYTTDGLNFTGDTTGVTVARTLSSTNNTLAVTGYKDSTDSSHQNIIVDADNTSGLALRLNNQLHVTDLRAGKATGSGATAGSVTIVGNSKNGSELQEVKITTGYDSETSHNPASKADNDGTTRLQYTNTAGGTRTLATLEDGLYMAADNGNTSGIGLNRTMTATGTTTSGTKAAALSTASNIGVTVSKDDTTGNGTWLFQLNRNLTDLDTVTAGGAYLGTQTPTYTLNGQTVNAASGSYLTGLTNRDWHVVRGTNGAVTSAGSIANTDGTYSIISGRAATEDQLLALTNSMNTQLEEHDQNSTFGLTADDTSSVTKHVGTTIGVKGTVSEDKDGKDATLKDGDGDDLTTDEGGGTVKNIKTKVVKPSDTDETTWYLGLSLADRIALNTALANTGSSISLYGKQETYHTASDGDITTNKIIQIDPDEGISLRQTDGEGHVKKDGVLITGPSDYYAKTTTTDSEGNTTITYTPMHQYDTNGSVGITNSTGEFTARMADMGGTGYLGLGNTLSTAGSSQTVNLNQLVKGTTADLTYMDTASMQDTTAARDVYGRVIQATDSEGNPYYMMANGSVTTDASKAVKAAGHSYYKDSSGNWQSQDVANLPVYAKTAENWVDDNGAAVYAVDGKGNPLYRTTDGTTTTTAAGNTAVQTTTAGALVSARYGTPSLISGSAANANGTLASNSSATMTRLQYLDEAHYDPTTGTYDDSVVHEVATMDDGLSFSGDYGSQLDLTLNNRLFTTGQLSTTAIAAINASSASGTDANNLARGGTAGNVKVATFTDTSSGSTSVPTMFIGLNKDLKGFNTIQIGGTTAASNSASSSDTIRIGNQANRESGTASTPLTGANFSNLRYVDTSTGYYTGPQLYEAYDSSSGTTYYTSDESDANRVQRYYQNGSWHRVNNGETAPTGLPASNYSYITIDATGAAASTAVTNGTDLSTIKVYAVTDSSGNVSYYTTQQNAEGTLTQGTTTLNPVNGRYETGLSNTYWDGIHIDEDRAATEGQLRQLQQQLITYNATSGGFALSDDSGTVVSRNLGSDIAIKGDTNITTTANDTEKTLTVALKKDVNLTDDGSLTAGGVKVGNITKTVVTATSTTNAEGNTTTTYSSAEQAGKGIDYGGNQAISLASGTTGKLWSSSNYTTTMSSMTPVEQNNLNNAANIGDIYNIANSTATTLVTNAVKAGKNITVSDGTEHTVNLSDNVTLGGAATSSTSAADGSLTIQKSDGTQTFKADSSTGLVTVGEDKKDSEGNVTSTAIKLGRQDSAENDDNGTVNAVTGLGNIKWDAGHITSGRAATEDQLQTVANEINNNVSNVALKFKGDTGNPVTVQNNGTLNLTGGETEENNLTPLHTDTENKHGNIGVVQKNDGELQVRLAKNLSGLESVTTGNTTMNTNGTTVHQTTIDQAGNTYNTTTNYGGNGVTINTAVTLNDGRTGNLQPVQISQTNVTMGGNQIHNIGSGYDGHLYQGDPRLNNAASIGDLESQGARLGGAINKLGNRVDKVGAGAAALAGLHPQDFDPEDKWDFAVGYGHYRSANAMAAGAFYRPDEYTMFSFGGSWGGGENMVNAGLTVKLGKREKDGLVLSRVAMAQQIRDLKATIAMQDVKLQKNDELEARVAKQDQEIAELKAMVKALAAKQA